MTHTSGSGHGNQRACVTSHRARAKKRCGNNANCGNDGYDCSAPGFENSGPKWWNSQAIFPTSDGTFVSEATSDGPNRLRLFYRGFDGLMYSVAQVIPGNSTKYGAPESWGTLLE